METEPLRRRGVRLAATLTTLRRESPIVIAIPSAGIVVGYEVARALDAPLDVVLAGRVRRVDGKAIGSVALGGVRIFDAQATAELSRDQVEELAAAELARQESLQVALRNGEPMAALRGRSVLLVDDAMITGLTAEAAVEALRARGVSAIHLAVPLGTSLACNRLREKGGDLICLQRVPPTVAHRLHEDAHAREPTPDTAALRALIVHAQQAAGFDLSNNLES